MNFPSCLFEIGATYVENMIILATVTCSSGKKYQNKQYISLLLLFSAFATFIVDVMNQIKDFSYVTPLLSMVFVIFISSKILSNGSLVIRSISAILAHLFIQCVDYIVVILIGHLTGKSEDFFNIFVSTSGVNRTTFVSIDKCIDIALFFLLRKQMPRLSKLASNLQVYLLILSAISYIVMQCLFQVVLLPNLSIMQLAIVASWCFLIGFIVSFTAFSLSLTKQKQDRQRLETLRYENMLMAENYKQLHGTQQSYARTLHDFKHHVTVVKEMISTGKIDSATEYLDSLLKTSYQQSAQCHSGNDIVDAIINSKLSEAQVKNIQFTFLANLHIPIRIDPVDLCGILANQLENAFEACTKIPDPSKRIVYTEIKQAQSFVFLKVENTVVTNPLIRNPKLHSDKKSSSNPHGYGLLNIQSIAQKYEGTVRTEYINDRFVSVVSLCDLPLDTKNTTD